MFIAVIFMLLYRIIVFASMTLCKAVQSNTLCVTIINIIIDDSSNSAIIFIKYSIRGLYV